MATPVAAGLILFAGCAQAPTPEIDAANAAIQRAQQAQVTEYAPEQMLAVSAAKAQLDAELEAQEESFSLFRSYGTAKDLAAAVTTAATEAETHAVEARTLARDEAASLIAEARMELVEVQSLLETAPRAKGSELDLAMLRDDVSGIESSLSETESAFSAERYLESKASAQAALDSAAGVREQIQRATQSRANVARS